MHENARGVVARRGFKRPCKALERCGPVSSDRYSGLELAAVSQKCGITSGTGHLYQGRFKSFPVQADEHFYTLVRYVERNALLANVVKRAEDWRWSSLWRRVHGEPEALNLLLRWPLPEPADWERRVNQAQTKAELKAVRESVRRGCPFGTSQWQVRTAKRLGLEWTLRPHGRPRNKDRSG